MPDYIPDDTPDNMPDEQLLWSRYTRPIQTATEQAVKNFKASRIRP